MSNSAAKPRVCSLASFTARLTTHLASSHGATGTAQRGFGETTGTALRSGRAACCAFGQSPPDPPRCYMYAFLISAGVVAAGEMGDKTQLLALLLAVRFRSPWPIILGILTATLSNHAAAGALGTWLRT